MGLTRGGGAVIMAEEPHFRRRNRGLTRPRKMASHATSIRMVYVCLYRPRRCDSTTIFGRGEFAQPVRGSRRASVAWSLITGRVELRLAGIAVA
jgi:hypothetical protein